MIRVVTVLVSLTLLALGAKWLADHHKAAGTRGMASRSRTDSAAWDALRELLQGWSFSQNFAVTVGDAKHGQLFKYEGGKFTTKTMIPTGSTSKWPSAMMFAGLVDDGTIGSLDDPVYKYLKFWTKDPKDMRSTVTVRMLLSFTSGFGGGHPGEEFNTRAAREWRKANNVKLASGKPLGNITACDQEKGDVMRCARSIYNGVQLIGPPGYVYSYNSNHLALAAAVSMAASGLSIEQIINKYLIQPNGMKDSWYMGKCPDFGAGLITTGDDYEKFMQGLLNYKTLSKKLIDASEEDSTPFMKDYPTLYGDYGFGHFLMCFDSVYGFTDECREAKCHMDPGAFGFIPIIDRKYGYYMQVVAAEIGETGSYPLSGIPEYLAVAIKPHIDAIMSEGQHVADYGEFSHHTPKYFSLSVADVNYCVDCKVNPAHCSN